MVSKPNIILGLLLIAAVALAVGTWAAGAVGPAAILGFVVAGCLVVAAVTGRVANRWLAPLLAGLTVIAVGAIAHGVIIGEPTITASGLLGLIVIGVGGGLAGALSGTSSTVEQPRGQARRIEELIEKLHEHSMLSETAKRVLFRDRELHLLRNVIEEDIHRGDYNAALRLCDDLADQFGYREEAESYRTRVNQLSREEIEHQVHEAMEQLQVFLTKRDWAAAHDVAARIRRLYPESLVQEDVNLQINRARAEHRLELEKAFIEAARREDVEVAMRHLRNLDRYLTREEADQLADVAQDVIAKHRENLSVQFKLAVNDHGWAEAARIGDTIISEFPNTKMAEEVRSMIDVLRTRATQAAVAAQGSER